VKWFDHITDLTVKWAGSLYAVLASVAFTLIWLLCGPFFAFSDTWQLWANTITTILTFVMVFIIQHSQNRDGAALQAKLDALIRNLPEVPNTYVAIDLKTEEEIEQLRDHGTANDRRD
jgi:low affinity Fe/Cu permease